MSQSWNAYRVLQLGVSPTEPATTGQAKAAVREKSLKRLFDADDDTRAHWVAAHWAADVKNLTRHLKMILSTVCRPFCDDRHRCM